MYKRQNYTIAENIVMGMEPVKKVLGCIPVVDMKKANQDIRNLSEKYGLAVNPTDVISDINVSTQQRVEILKMLYREAEILIFDEPTAVLTPQEIDFLLDIIKSCLLYTSIYEPGGSRDRCDPVRGLFCKSFFIYNTDPDTGVLLRRGRSQHCCVAGIGRRGHRSGSAGKSV